MNNSYQEHVSATETGRVDVVTLAEYSQIRVNCCKSHKDDIDDFSTALAAFADEIDRRTTPEILASAAVGNAADILEAGIRLWSGCGVKKDLQRAMEWWMRISVEHQPQSGSPVPKKIRVRALSCLANSHWELKQLPNDRSNAWNIDSIYRAAALADTCASLGFVSATVLTVGTRVRELLREPIISDEHRLRFSPLGHLWEAVDKRNAQMEKEMRKRVDKVAKAPNAYVCAAEGCGIEGTSRSALLKCGGKCPMELKPAYCSKECQKADWKRHKPSCNPNATIASFKVPAEDIEVETSASQSLVAGPKTAKAAIGENLRTDGRQVRIDVPRFDGGPGKTTIASKTISPQFMKEFREALEKN